MCLQTLGRPHVTKEYVEELLKFHNKWELYGKLKNWQVPKFPVSGNMLKQNGCPQGRTIGRVISKLKEVWIQHEFKSTAEDLLKHLPAILEELNIVDGMPVKKPKLN